ncbi:MAG: hypothetical protein WDW38_008329 [Sanguina aurantia]
MSGLLTGILFSRTLAGFVATWASWRAMFWVGVPIALLSALLMALCLPRYVPTSKVSYRELLVSIIPQVLDSPFAKLTELMLEIVQSQKIIPQAFARLALGAMRRSVRKRACFDINSLNPIDLVGESFIPALFGHAIGDHFVKISHSERLHASYAGDKNFIRFDGDHNSLRPPFFYNSVAIFFHNTLQLEETSAASAPPPQPAPRYGPSPHTRVATSGPDTLNTVKRAIHGAIHGAMHGAPYACAATCTRVWPLQAAPPPPPQPTTPPPSLPPPPQSKVQPAVHHHHQQHQHQRQQRQQQQRQHASGTSSSPAADTSPRPGGSSSRGLSPPPSRRAQTDMLSDPGSPHSCRPAAGGDTDAGGGEAAEAARWTAAFLAGSRVQLEGEPDTEEEEGRQLLLALQLSMMDLQQGSRAQHAPRGAATRAAPNLDGGAGGGGSPPAEADPR